MSMVTIPTTLNSVHSFTLLSAQYMLPVGSVVFYKVFNGSMGLEFSLCGIDSTPIRSGYSLSMIEIDFISPSGQLQSIVYDNTIFVHTAIDGVAIVPPSSGGSTVDIPALVSALTPLFNSILDRVSAAALSSQNLIHESTSSLSIKLDSIDLQVPFDLNAQLAQISTHSFPTLQQLIDGVKSCAPFNLTPVDITNLNGNFCKFKNGDHVVVDGYTDIWTVEKVQLMVAGDNLLTLVYHVLAADGRRLPVPQNLIAPASLVV